MKPGIDVLRTLPLFAGCAPALLSRLNAAADLARLGPGEVLFREGEALGELNVLIAGYAVTTRSQPGVEDTMVDVIEPIRPIGLPTAVLGCASPIGARTVTSARIIVIGVAELRAMIHRTPALQSAFFDHALRELREVGAETARLKLLTAPQRLAGYLVSLVKEPEVSPARFVLPYEKRFLAARIGCSQENLSRAFAALRRLGVETRGSVVVIRDAPGLRVFAGLPATH
jgi:CRP/FNR family transcriptional activator FtrB